MTFQPSEQKLVKEISAQCTIYSQTDNKKEKKIAVTVILYCEHTLLSKSSLVSIQETGHGVPGTNLDLVPLGYAGFHPASN